MSHAKPAETLQGTRQLLDELDALMDQMLSLPVAEQESFDAAPQANDSPSAAISATLTMLDTAPGTDVSLDSAPSAPTTKDFGPASMQYTTDDDVAPIPLLSVVAAPKVVEPMSLPVRPRIARWRPDDVAYHFLRWVNQRYDRSTTWLGKPGELFRGRWARTLLGLGGLGLLALALGWLCKDWMGWNW